MTLPDLLATLDAQGVCLSARLVVDAPSGALTPELRDALAAHKALLLERLVREMVWAERSTWRWGPATGDPTPGIVIDRPDPARRRAALEIAADDPYAIAECEAIRAEADLCGLNTRSMDNEGDGGGRGASHPAPLVRP